MGSSTPMRRQRIDVDTYLEALCLCASNRRDVPLLGSSFGGFSEIHPMSPWSVICATNRNALQVR
eukprot:1914417-Amphidinium_carterae.1